MDQPLFGDELRRLRRAAHISLKAFAKLVHYDASYISKLENSIKQPTQDVAAACDNVLNTGQHLQTLAAHSRSLSPSIKTSSLITVTPESLSVFESLLTAFVQADAVLGPCAAIDGVREQARFLETLLSSTLTPLRKKVLHLNARYAEFAGWLLQDSGKLKEAAAWSLKALDMAAELGDPQLLSYLWMRRSNIASDAGHYAESATLARAALHNNSCLPSSLRALALRQLANAASLSGNTDDCTRAINDALAELDRSPNNIENTLAKYCGQPYIRSEGAACWTRLGRPDLAISLLSNTVDQWPTGQERDHGLALARLANAHALAGDIDQACSIGTQAAIIRQSVTSTRTTRELRQLQQRLRGRSSYTPVMELLSKLRGII